MPNNYTPNYKLNQWEKSDQVLMDDFNADNAKMDAALKALADGKADKTALAAKTQITAGTYTGDGAAERTVGLGFTPKAVYVCADNGRVYLNGSSGAGFYGGLALPGAPVAYRGHGIVEIVPGGFKVFREEEKLNNVTSNYYNTNSDGIVFHYIAFQ